MHSFSLVFLFCYLVSYASDRSITDFLLSPPSSDEHEALKKEMEIKARTDYERSSKGADAVVQQALQSLQSSAIELFDQFPDPVTGYFKKEFVHHLQQADRIYHVCRRKPSVTLLPGCGKLDKEKNSSLRRSVLEIIKRTAQSLGFHGDIFVQISPVAQDGSPIGAVGVHYEKPSLCSTLHIFICPSYERYFLQNNPKEAVGITFHEISHNMFGLSFSLEGLVHHWNNYDKNKACAVFKKLNHLQEIFADLYALNKNYESQESLELVARAVLFSDKESSTHPSGATRYRNICYFNALYKWENDKKLHKNLPKLSNFLSTIKSSQALMYTPPSVKSVITYQK